MKKRENCLTILFALAIFCVVCFAVHRKNNISDIQENSSNLDMQENNSNLDIYEENNIPVTDRQEDTWENHLGKLDVDAEIDLENPENAIIKTDDNDVVLAISSEDNKYTVFVRRENYQKLYIYNTEKNELNQIDVTPDLVTDIMTLEWIGTDKVAVWSHVNPSLGCLDIYDVNGLQKLVEKYCSFYSLTEEIDSLVYVEPAPHFSSAKGDEVILNIDDEILYQTGKKETISSIDSNDNEDIAIVVEKENANYETESTELVVLKKNKKKYKIKEKTKLKRGEGAEINWINNKKISYSTRKKGVNKIKKISK